MDKSLNRAILYKPPTKIETGTDGGAITKINTIPKEVVEKRVDQKKHCGKDLAEWLTQAALINRSALCKVSGLDRANLDKYLQKGEIPEKYIKGLIEILSLYGYKH